MVFPTSTQKNGSPETYRDLWRCDVAVRGFTKRLSFYLSLGQKTTAFSLGVVLVLFEVVG